MYYVYYKCFCLNIFSSRIFFMLVLFFLFSSKTCYIIILNLIWLLFCFVCHLKSFSYIFSECFLFSFGFPRFYSGYFNINVCKLSFFIIFFLSHYLDKNVKYKIFHQIGYFFHVIFTSVTNIFTTVSRGAKTLNTTLCVSMVLVYVFVFFNFAAKSQLSQCRPLFSLIIICNDL